MTRCATWRGAVATSRAFPLGGTRLVTLAEDALLYSGLGLQTTVPGSEPGGNGLRSYDTTTTPAAVA